jgi:hypothetical protein
MAYNCSKSIEIYILLKIKKKKYIIQQKRAYKNTQFKFVEQERAKHCKKKKKNNNYKQKKKLILITSKWQKKKKI